eukprot:1601374-Rhodomonas_salina.1
MQVTAQLGFHAPDSSRRHAWGGSQQLQQQGGGGGGQHQQHPAMSAAEAMLHAVSRGSNAAPAGSTLIDSEDGCRSTEERVTVFVDMAGCRGILKAGVSFDEEGGGRIEGEQRASERASERAKGLYRVGQSDTPFSPQGLPLREVPGAFWRT